MAERQDGMRIPDAIAQMLARRTSDGDEAVAVGSRAGVVEWTNSAWRRVTGWALEDVIDKPVSHLLDQVGVERAVLDFVESHFAAGRRCAVELGVDGADGRPRAIHLDVEPVRDAGGDVTHFVAVASDVTARRRSEPGPDDVASSVARTGSPHAGAPAAGAAGLAVLEGFAAEALATARSIDRLCAEIERMTAVGLLDELGVRAVRERAAEAGDRARLLVDRAAGHRGVGPVTDPAAAVRAALATRTDALLARRVQLDVDCGRAVAAVRADAEALTTIVGELVDDGAAALDETWGTLSVTTGTTVPGRPLASPVYHASFPGTLHDESRRCFVEVHDTGTSLSPGALRRLRAPLLGAPADGRVARLLEARARLAVSGAELHVHATPGCGTRVLLLLVLADD